MNIGDSIKMVGNAYSITRENDGCEGVIFKVNPNTIDIKVTKHKDLKYVGQIYLVDKKDVKIINEGEGAVKMSKFKIGDVVKAMSENYGFTSLSNNCVGVVTDVRNSSSGESQIKLKVTQVDNYLEKIGCEWWVNSKDFEYYQEFKVGDTVEALEGACYFITTARNCFQGNVSKVSESQMTVCVLASNHLPEIGNKFTVDKRDFKIVHTDLSETKKNAKHSIDVYSLTDILKSKEESFEYTPLDKSSIKSLYIADGKIDIVCNESIKTLTLDVEQLFKKREKKSTVRICEIQHAQNGKIYEFIAENLSCSYLGEFVICDTRYGKSYGKCVGTRVELLTSKEIAEYKTCKLA